MREVERLAGILLGASIAAIVVYFLLKPPAPPTPPGEAKIEIGEVRVEW